MFSLGADRHTLQLIWLLGNAMNLISFFRANREVLFAQYFPISVEHFRNSDQILYFEIALTATLNILDFAAWPQSPGVSLGAIKKQIVICALLGARICMRNASPSGNLHAEGAESVSKCGERAWEETQSRINHVLTHYIYTHSVGVCSFQEQ